MERGGVLPRAVVAKVIFVYAIDNVLETPLPSELLHATEQLVLAVKAAIGIVGHVGRIVELVGENVFVVDPELGGERLGVAFVRLGNGGRIGGDGQATVAENLLCRPGEIRRVGAARISDQNTAKRSQVSKELFLFLEQPVRIGQSRGGPQSYQCRHA